MLLRMVLQTDKNTKNLYENISCFDVENLYKHIMVLDKINVKNKNYSNMQTNIKINNNTVKQSHDG